MAAIIKRGNSYGIKFYYKETDGSTKQGWIGGLTEKEA